MAIQPVVGKQFKTANGQKATIRDRGPADQGGYRFTGEVRDNGVFNYTFWKNDGVSVNPDYNLVADWPTDSPERYFAIMPTSDGAWYVTGPLYNSVSGLKKDWVPKGCVWYLSISRDMNGNPATPTITAIT